jgi:hypothetical protein
MSLQDVLQKAGLPAGQPLDARVGPFQIVVPGEKKHARWVRQVTGLRIGKG